jgi:hypothetical protein
VVHSRRQRRRRRLFFEPLESRLLLASDWQNPVNHLDVNADCSVSPIDALIVINHLIQFGSHRLDAALSSTQSVEHFIDTNGDQFVSPTDALLPINALIANDGLLGLLAELANDTSHDGRLNNDAITNDATIVGRAIEQITGADRVEARLDGGSATPLLEDLLGIPMATPCQPLPAILFVASSAAPF